MIDLQTKPALRPLAAGVTTLAPVIRLSGFPMLSCDMVRRT